MRMASSRALWSLPSMAGAPTSTTSPLLPLPGAAVLVGPLLAEAEADLRSQRARRAYVEMSEANTAGLALCASSGFEPEGDIALVKELHG
jgi:hypothetical protein